MKILLANPRGFCAGVEMAIRCLEIVLERLPGPVYVFHEIVHNQHVVHRFENEGVVFIDDVAEVPRGGTLVFSAHGVSPAVRRQAKERKLRTIDATCPLVAKVHTEAVRFAQLGYEIVLIGHAGHDEVEGTLGEVPERIRLIQRESDVDDLPFNQQDRLAYLTQTTLSVDETTSIVARLRGRFPQIQGPATDDICYATQNRQQAVRELLQEADVVLVLGSQNSSNSRRMCEVATEHGIAAHLVEGPEQLEADWFSRRQTVGISAGASAPESSVLDVISWLSDRFPVEVQRFGQDEPRREFSLPADLLQLESAQD